MAVFVGLGVWWGLPVVVGVLIARLIAVQPAAAAAGRAGSGRERARRGPALPARFWVFAGFALLYGVVETTNGNWATLYMTTDLGATATLASLALTTFWAMVTVGPDPVRRHRAAVPGDADVPAAAVRGRRRARRAGDPAGRHATAGVLAFGLAGLGCSALLPLTISFGQRELVASAHPWPAC